MARVVNNTRTTVTNAQEYIRNQIRISNKKLQQSENLIKQLIDDGSFTTRTEIDAYKDKLIDDAKDATKKSVRMFRWIFAFLNITSIPSAFNDAQVDREDPDIRTHEE